MSDTFRDGLEAAARLVEQEDPGLLGGECLRAMAHRIRELRDGEVMSADQIMAAFGEFKAVYPDGPRNHWKPALESFRKCLKAGHEPATIVAGTAAYAATRPAPQYVPAPSVFLNQERFLSTYGPPRPPNGSLFDVERELRGQ
jgi:hypothetical protein